MKYKILAEKIIELKNADLELRDQLIQKGTLGNGYNEEMEKLHNENAAQLNAIIDEIGYPTIDKVGEEGSKAAWLVIQHAISKPQFMRKCVKLLEIAVSENDANPVLLAYLADRIAVYGGEPQLYGTQFDWDENGEFSPQPFDNLNKVNQRRTSIGLNTLQEQTEVIRRQASNENQHPPKDFEKRQAEINKWRKKVGWIK